MNVNPVWQREIRARWRGWRSYALLFAYVVFLAGIIIWCYNDFSTRAYYGAYFANPQQRMAALGNELFSALSAMQALLWMLIPAVLTATAISFERERGLLEGLLLSHLSTPQIVNGKLLSALSLCGLLILVALPLEAVCFLMGGVSPGDFFAALSVHATTALLSGAIGLAVSAWSRKSPEAVGVTFVALIFWWSVTLALAGSNPVIAMTHLSRTGYGAPSLGDVFSWQWCCGLNLLLTPLVWAAAVRGTRIILKEPRRIEWERLRRELQSQTDTPAKLEEQKIVKRLELGILARLKFENPILEREVRACFRPRSSSPFMTGLLLLLSPFALFAYGVALYQAFIDLQWRESGPIAILMVFLLLTMLLMPLLGAGSFARERETDTLTSLRLSLLGIREIILGKLGAPLVVCGFCALFCIPLLTVCIRYIAYRPGPGMFSLSQAVGGLLLIAASSWCLVLFSLTISWYCKRVVTAMCWTIGLLLALYVGVPGLLSLVTNGENSPTIFEFLRWWHPCFGMLALIDRRQLATDGNTYRASTMTDAFTSSLTLFFIGSIFLFILWRGLRKNTARNY